MRVDRLSETICMVLLVATSSPQTAAVSWLLQSVLRQWQSLARATEIEPHLSAMETALGSTFLRKVTGFKAVTRLAALITPWMAKRTLAEVAKVFDDLGVCWGPYQTFTQLVEEDWRCSEENPMFSDIDATRDRHLAYARDSCHLHGLAAPGSPPRPTVG